MSITVYRKHSRVYLMTNVSKNNLGVHDGTHPRPSARSWQFCCGELGAPGAGVLLGVMREIGEWDSPVAAAADAAGPSSVGSEWQKTPVYPLKAGFHLKWTHNI